jgi:hypothetical protein
VSVSLKAQPSWRHTSYLDSYTIADDMRLLLRVSVCFTVFLSTMAAQEAAQSAAKLPPAMQAAIDRIAKGGTAETGLKRTELQAHPSAQSVCSVPLLEMRIDNPERFTMQRLQPKHNDLMPRLAVPAPPCDQNNR